MRTIKGITTNEYTIQLNQTDTGMYVIEFACKSLNQYPLHTEMIKDLGIASYLFDLKVKDLASFSK